MKHGNMWTHPHNVWGTLHVGAGWFLIQNLLQLFHFGGNTEQNASMNWF
jgi:hypothetical protein